VCSRSNGKEKELTLVALEDSPFFLLETSRSDPRTTASLLRLETTWSRYEEHAFWARCGQRIVENFFFSLRQWRLEVYHATLTRTKSNLTFTLY